jgi:trimeric autotransporter adhesin
MMKTFLNYAMVSFLLIGLNQQLDAQWITNGNNLPNGNKFLGTLSTSTFKDVILKTNGIEALRVLGSNQFVGIGTNAPTAKLEVKNGNAKINGLTIGIGAGTTASNTALGYNTLSANTIGYANTATGYTALSANTTGYYNTATGYQALENNTTGFFNTANGLNALIGNTTGNSNTACGTFALFSNSSGANNIAVGSSSLAYNTIGTNNTASGFSALFSNTTASNNTAYGYQSLYTNTTGYSNTAIGLSSLYSNTDGFQNIALGVQALYSNTDGYGNIANGNVALYHNTIGNYNIANGYNAMISNITGSYNTISGYVALYSSTSGSSNTVYGSTAMYNNSSGSNNTAIGSGALFGNGSGSNNTALGNGADVSTGNLSNATAIGNGAIVGLSNKIRLGNSAVTIIEGNAMYTVSDGRFKTNITDNVKGLEFINKLRPVQYNFEAKKFDEFLSTNSSDEIKKRVEQTDYSSAEKIRYDGFIAQEVESAAKETGYQFNGIHVPQNDNDNYSLAYSEFVVPLVKSVQELSKQNDDLKSQLATVNARLDALEKGQGSSIDSKSTSGSLNSTMLEQNTPNPFSQSTTIRYSIPDGTQNAQLVITDLTGKVLKTYSISSGAGQQVINGNELKAGSYIYSFTVNGKIMDTKQMVITK